MICQERPRGPLKPCRNAIWRIGRVSLRFWTTLGGVSGVQQKRVGAARLAEGSASSGYMVPAANAASCLAQAKAVPKP